MEIIFHSHSNKTHFQKKGCTPSLILKVRGLELGGGLLSVLRVIGSKFAAWGVNGHSSVMRDWLFHNAWRVIFLWNLRDDWYHSKLVLVMTPTSCPFMSFLDVWFPQIGYYFILFFRDAWWLKKIGLMRVGYPLLFPHVLYAVFFPSVG